VFVTCGLRKNYRVCKYNTRRAFSVICHGISMTLNCIYIPVLMCYISIFITCLGAVCKRLPLRPDYPDKKSWLTIFVYIKLMFICLNFHINKPFPLPVLKSTPVFMVTGITFVTKRGIIMWSLLWYYDCLISLYFQLSGCHIIQNKLI